MSCVIRTSRTIRMMYDKDGVSDKDVMCDKDVVYAYDVMYDRTSCTIRTSWRNVA